jgi:predicted amidohydrolase YtcJ
MTLSNRLVGPNMHAPADLVLRGGAVLTMDGDRRASAIAVRDGRIVAIGDDSEMTAHQTETTQVIELQGRTVLPGFADVHTHVSTNARDPRNAECRDFFEDVASVGDILDRLAEVAKTSEPSEWVVGIGGLLQEVRLQEGRLPTRAELDQATGEHPAYVTFGPHLIVANSAALQLAGIGPDTPDPQGGEIDRDPDGAPSGVLREQAQHLVRSLRPAPAADLEDRLYAELVACARRGVTTIHEIVKSTAEVRAYQRLDEQGRLPVRVHLMFRIFQSTFDTWSLLDLGLETGFGSDRLRIGGVKVSVDGGDDKRTGFREAPGDDELGFKPLLRMSQSDLDPIISKYHARGMRILVHAVGDLALDMTLDSFEKAIEENPRADHRHRVEHMGNFMMTPEKLQRAIDLGVIPVPNPTSLFYVGDVAEHGMGPLRTQDSFPFRRLLESEAPFAIASDGPGLWPIDPLRDVETCVTRVTRSGVTLSPDESIGVLDALTAVTRTAAWLGFVEESLGTLEVGKLADLAVLDTDPLTCPTDELASIRVDLTVMGGTITHTSEAVPQEG